MLNALRVGSPIACRSFLNQLNFFNILILKHYTEYFMQYARFVLLAVPFALLTAFAFAQYSSAPFGPGVDQLCKECGVIYEIRQLTSERKFARTLEDQPSPPGSTISIPLTNRPEANKPYFGAYGSRTMRKQLEEHVYEVVVRYNDGRFTRIEMSDISDLSLGAKVRVYQNRIELYDLQ
jgi:hypothetical protein